MIKVLDARSVNGQVLGFFGALSNVEYTITVRQVTRRLPEVYRIQQAPSRPSATLGLLRRSDRDAGGRPRRMPCPQRFRRHGRNASSATGADGTVFTLDVPPDSLRSPQTVTLRRYRARPAIPFAGGLVAGVRDRARRTCSSRAGDAGDPAHRRPPSPEQTSRTPTPTAGKTSSSIPGPRRGLRLRLPLVRFGGYGVAKGSLNDAETQAESATTGPCSSYVQRYALDDRVRRAVGLITPCRARKSVRSQTRLRRPTTEQVAPQRSMPPTKGHRKQVEPQIPRRASSANCKKFLDLLVGVSARGSGRPFRSPGDPLRAS